MKHYTYIVTTLLLLCIYSNGWGQDYSLINGSDINTTVDHPIVLREKPLNQIDIGPRRYNGKNTIFFNNDFIIATKVDSVSINNSYFKNLVITNAIVNLNCVFDSINANSLDINFSSLHNGIRVRKSKIENVFLNDNTLNVTDNNVNYNDIGIKIDVYKSEITDFISNNNRFHSSFFLQECDINTLAFYEDFLDTATIFMCKTKFLRFPNSYVKNLFIVRTEIENWLNLSHTTIENKLEIKGCNLSPNCIIDLSSCLLPDTVVINNTKINTTIDFINADYSNRKKKIILSINTPSVDKLRLQYQHFKLVFREELDFDHGASQFEALLKNFNTNGQKRSYQLCDIDYQEYTYSKKPTYKRWLVVFPKYWNNFGYDKDWVFGWALLFLGIFTILTFFLFDKLTREVYPISNIPIQPKWNIAKQGVFTTKVFWNRLWYSFVYTSVVFFLISLKVGNIDYRKKGHVFYLMLMYTIGIICLAYMANFIITR